MIQECLLGQSCLLNDMTLNKFYSKAIGVCAGGLQIILNVKQILLM